MGNINKKAKQAYKSIIDELANGIIIECQKKAFEVTDTVFKDILSNLRERINQLLADDDSRTD